MSMMNCFTPPALKLVLGEPLRPRSLHEECDNNMTNIKSIIYTSANTIILALSPSHYCSVP